MTDTNQKIRALVLTALMVLSVFAGTIALSGSAAAVNPTRGNTGADNPAVVYLGETGINVQGNTNINNGSETFTGTAGDADGTVVSVTDTSSVDFTESNGWTTGGYDTASDGIDLSVTRAAVSNVDVNLGNDTSGADVTDGTVPSSEGNVTIEADYNFGSASYVEISVTDDDGLDVTNQLNSTQTIDNSGGTLILDVSGLSPGTYTVEAGAPVPSGLAYASRSVEFTVASAATSIDLDSTDVTQGENVIATVSGTPGENVTVAVASNKLASGKNATDLYADTSDVLDTNTSGSAETVVIDLGDDGQGQLRINTANLKAGQTATVEVYEGGMANNQPASTSGAADDSVDLTVSKRSVSMSAPNSVIAGETFDISGTAAQSVEVQAFVRIGDDWIPLNDTNGYAEDTSIGGDGSYELTVDTSTSRSDEISIPDTYQIGVIAGGSAIADSSATRSEFNANVSTTRSITVTSGSLTASLSEQRIAEGDDVTVSGSAIGQGSTVRVYVVGPRGGVGWANASVDAATNEYTIDYDSDFTDADDEVSGGNTFDRTGTYTVIVVGAGRNGDFANIADGIVSPGNLASEQIALIENAYTGAGVDDTMQSMTFVGENPTVSIDSAGTNGQVTPGTVTVSGTSNRVDATSIFVDAITADGEVLASGTGEVNGSTDAWTAELDLSDVSTGQTITLTAEDANGNSDRLDVEVVSEISTPTEEPTTTAPPTTTEEPTEEPTTEEPTEEPTTEMTTEEPTEETTEPEDGQPGFGIAIAIVALLGAGLLALRRRD